jgi:glycerophosphoryl diester phosphodiesterase
VSRGRRTLVAAALLLLAALPSHAAGPLVAAHRGGALLWPENSLLAYRNALSLGVDLLETDVHLTADGEVVVLHDPTLERTTTGAGAVRDARRTDLALLRLRARDGSATQEPIPTLDQLLALLRPGPHELLLEIKVGPQRQPYAGIEAETLARVRAAGVLDRVVVMAFEADTLRRVRALEPSVRLALIVSRTRVTGDGGGPDTPARWAIEAGATHLAIDHRVIDAGVVASAHRAGLKIAAWTVNDESDLRRVLDLGVDVVITDRPDLALRLRR